MKYYFSKQNFYFCIYVKNYTTRLLKIYKTLKILDSPSSMIMDIVHIKLYSSTYRYRKKYSSTYKKGWILIN